MRYQLIYIVPASTKDEEVTTTRTKVTSTINQHKGTILKESQVERKRLAYAIKRIRQCLYHFIEFEVESKELVEIARTLRLHPTILRFMITKAPTRETVGRLTPPPKLRVAKTEEKKEKKEVDLAELDKKLDEILSEEIKT